MGFRGGGGQIPPPSISWYSSTPAGIGLTFSVFYNKHDNQETSDGRSTTLKIRNLE